MVKGVIVVAILIASAMAVVKDGRALRSVGLTSSCTTVARNADGTELAVCRAGKLEGAPDLGMHGCTIVSGTQSLRYWHCPSAVEASQAGR
jgi:hypothetical protein